MEDSIILNGDSKMNWAIKSKKTGKYVVKYCGGVIEWASNVPHWRQCHDTKKLAQETIAYLGRQYNETGLQVVNREEEERKGRHPFMVHQYR